MNVRAQADSRAEANQLHAAIVNGDVESVRYWLTVRHADASAANAAEPDITPLQRCLGLAARVLDAPPGGESASPGTAAPPVGLRALQEMVTLLHEHGARLTDTDRTHFSGPVLRWYDDAVSPRRQPSESTPAAPAPAPSQPPSASSGTPVVAFSRTVVITTDPRQSCNGTGHVVYLMNHTLLSITAKVTTHEDGAEAASGSQKTGTYSVDPEGSWWLGCDTSTSGRPVRYVLDSWR